jgi:hypothetical protein
VSEEITSRLVSSFPLRDLLDGYVLYEQNNHQNKEPAWDGFLFHVSDGTNQSPTHRVNISILVNTHTDMDKRTHTRTYTHTDIHTHRHGHTHTRTHTNTHMDIGPTSHRRTELIYLYW